MARYLRYFILICAVFQLLNVRAAIASSSNPKEKLIITGTGSGIGAMQLMARAFQKKKPAAVIEVLPSIGSTGGIKAVSEDRIDIGLSYRPVKPEERKKDMIEEPYARTAFIFGAQASNPARGLRLTEIEEIYACKRRNWDDGMPIRFILRPLSDGLSEYLAGISPGLKWAAVKARSTPGVFVGMTDQEAATQIEKTPGSFGITTASLVMAEKRRIKALAIDGVAPTLDHVSNGRYPYALTLYLICKRDKDEIRDFIEFIFSDDGRSLLAENGHITLLRVTKK